MGVRFRQTGVLPECCEGQLHRHGRSTASPSQFPSDRANPVPPLPEQRRIVAILDAADELRRLRAEADRCTVALIPSLFHSMFGEQVEGSSDWPRTEVQQVAEVTAGFAWKSEYFSDSPDDGPAVVRIQNLGSNDNAQLAFYRGDIVPGYWIDHDEILVSLSGSFKAYRWTGQKALLNQRIVVVRPGHAISDDYLFAHLSFRLEEISKSAVGAAVANASMGSVRNMKIPLPPPELRKAFADCIDEIRAMQEAKSQSHLRLDDLFHSLLDRAFKGEL